MKGAISILSRLTFKCLNNVDGTAEDKEWCVLVPKV